MCWCFIHYSTERLHFSILIFVSQSQFCITIQNFIQILGIKFNFHLIVFCTLSCGLILFYILLNGAKILAVYWRLLPHFIPSAVLIQKIQLRCIHTWLNRVSLKIFLANVCNNILYSSSNISLKTLFVKFLKRTASLTFSIYTFCSHSVFMCFVWISEQRAIISLYSIN